MLSCFVSVLLFAGVTLGQAIAPGGGTFVTPAYNTTFSTCETELWDIAISGVPPYVAGATFYLVPNINAKDTPLYLLNDWAVQSISGGWLNASVTFPSDFNEGTAPSAGYTLNVLEYAVNNTSGETFSYMFSTQINVINDGTYTENGSCGFCGGCNQISCD